MSARPASKSYAEKLRDPRWQKKRLEIFEAAEWACAECGKKTEELHVHHLLYRRGRSPWEYENDYLVALCSTCHEKAESAKSQLEEAIAGYAAVTCRYYEIYSELAGLVDGFLRPDVRSGDNHAYNFGASLSALSLAAIRLAIDADKRENSRAEENGKENQ